ncbi:hypothetical protein L0636_00935 [Halomonas janggokensis]|uniref:Uncharacterized protein n=1 Tax=Vreelandella janggokensis TaxID=370767 RepID=A0ABT4ITX9_9GAMM|nr:hypothetical protein [Halomonas janggokensis]MCZ0926452.1 hypothetical protein [Halomonas janggokensis]MCZ0928990.1 hypothetical protein [Halomonas janggokensis]
MINFPVLRTKRLTVRMKELAMLDAIALAAIPDHLNEEATTAFLRASIDSIQGVESPEDWTVQERTMAVCHYMASVMDDGPDFSLANGEARFSDYLVGDQDYPDDLVEIGDIEGDRWQVRHLTGAMAGSIERLHGEIPNVSGYAHWRIGRMAAQLVPNGKAVPIGGDIDAAMIERMNVIARYPESVFTRLIAAFEQGRQALDHLFIMEADEHGLIALPKGGSAAEEPPARFPVGACITGLAKHLGGKSAVSGA